MEMRCAGRTGRLLVRSILAGVGAGALVAHLMGSLTSSASDAPAPAPEISVQTWINSPPQRLADLRGSVVLLEFWTLGCFNCRNVEPHVKGWHGKYGDRGLVVIGIHTPETPTERRVGDVERYVREHGIRYAVAVDNDFTTWRRFDNHAWPALYLIDRRGMIRLVQVGEGGYAALDQTIQSLLDEP